MPTTERTSLLSDLELCEPAAKAWWAALLKRRGIEPRLDEPRPVWNADARESYRAEAGALGAPASFYPLRTFYGCLGEELDQAKRQGQLLAVVVLELPDQPSREQQREQETALRLAVRSGDLTTRLSPTTLAVALPRCQAQPANAALRLQRMLTAVVGGKVGAGMACFPADGSTALELLRAATWRSLTELGRKELDPELARLLGPLTPGAGRVRVDTPR
jgi:hypothetical protein